MHGSQGVGGVTCHGQSKACLPSTPWAGLGCVDCRWMATHKSQVLGCTLLPWTAWAGPGGTQFHVPGHPRPQVPCYHEALPLLKPAPLPAQHLYCIAHWHSEPLLTTAHTNTALGSIQSLPHVIRDYSPSDIQAPLPPGAEPCGSQRVSASMAEKGLFVVHGCHLQTPPEMPMHACGCPSLRWALR